MREAVTDVTSLVPSDKLPVIHNVESVGMEAASNIGITASESEYLVINDNDDTWHLGFLEKTVSYLDARGPSHVE